MYEIENKIRDKLFWKYETCWCEKYRHPHPQACQVKSKFGGLRFYMTHSTDKMEDLIRKAERRSETICEKCGQPGKMRDGGWIWTLCDECDKQRKKTNENT
jgi:ribosomal protein L37AE/L43A